MKQVWERLRAELVEIIEWSDAIPGAPSTDGDTLAWRFRSGDGSGRDSAIRNGAQLIVREGQWAVFLDEGRIADAFGPGRHTLSTANLPLLTTLLCLPTGFESPFKAEVVFVATRLFSDLKWGTRQPVLLRDPELGPVRLRGFGSYSLRVNDPAWLVREVTGSSGRVDLPALQDPLRSLIVSRLADVLGSCGCPAFDLSSRYAWLSRDLRLALVEDVQPFGLELPSLLIEALTLPPEVEAALVRRSVRLVEGEAANGLPANRLRSTGASQAMEAPKPRRAPPPPPPLPGTGASPPASPHPEATATTQAGPPATTTASAAASAMAGSNAAGGGAAPAPASQPCMRSTDAGPPEPTP